MITTLLKETQINDKRFNWIDTHCHFFDLSERNVKINYNSFTSKFISCALDEEEMKWHKSLSQPKVKWVAGIHPSYKKSNEKYLSFIEKLAQKKEIIGIGEIGFDKKNPDNFWQKKILLAQLDLANQFSLPVLFHTVGMYYDLYKVLQNNFPKVRGILHGFHGSKDIVNTFLKFDLLFSIGCHPPKQNSLDVIIKNKRFCFETDAPYQAPDRNDTNILENLQIPIQSIRDQSDLNFSEIDNIQQKNVTRLFPTL